MSFPVSEEIPCLRFTVSMPEGNAHCGLRRNRRHFGLLHDHPPNWNKQGKHTTVKNAVGLLLWSKSRWSSPKIITSTFLNSMFGLHLESPKTIWKYWGGWLLVVRKTRIYAASFPITMIYARYNKHRPSSKCSFSLFSSSQEHTSYFFSHHYEAWRFYIHKNCAPQVLVKIWPQIVIFFFKSLTSMIRVKALCWSEKGDLCDWASFRVVTMM